MRIVCKYEERTECSGKQSLLKDAKKYAEELGLTLQMNSDDELVCHSKVKDGD